MRAYELVTLLQNLDPDTPIVVPASDHDFRLACASPEKVERIDRRSFAELDTRGDGTQKEILVVVIA